MTDHQLNEIVTRNTLCGIMEEIVRKRYSKIIIAALRADQRLLVLKWLEEGSINKYEAAEINEDITANENDYFPND